jgi:putative dimethyl sulfoxide reductase chaperone
MTDNQTALAKAELYLCLARAFATPATPAFLPALRDDLPADLAALGAQLGCPLEPALADYRASIADVADAQQLLVLYARLFLVPGEHHPSLNTTAYLDGARAGGSLAMLEQCRTRCGLERHRDFRDLPDHPSAQLELVAWLFAAQAAPASEPQLRAAAFLSRFVARWIGPWRAELEAATDRFRLAANPYLHLARVLEAAVLHELRADRPAPTAETTGIDPEIARLRRQYAGREIGAEDIAMIRARLAADGLASGHVAIPEDIRDRTMGLATMTPPMPASHRLDGRG